MGHSKRDRGIYNQVSDTCNQRSSVRRNNKKITGRNKISKELADVLLLDIEPTDEMAKIAEKYQIEFFNNFSDINREILDQSGNFINATRNYIQKTPLRDIVEGETPLPIAPSQIKLLKEQTVRDQKLNLADEKIKGAKFNDLVDNIFIALGFPLGDKEATDEYGKGWYEQIERFKNGLILQRKN